MEKYEKTKLNSWLSDIGEVFGIMLFWLLIVLIPVIGIEQICIWATNLIQSWIF